MTDNEERLLRLQGISVSDGKTGLCCSQCGCADLRVNNTIKSDGAVVRYRSCRNCGAKFRTQERRG
jgi:hypothetical protein